MKTMRRVQLERIPYQESVMLAPCTDGVVRLYRLARDFIEEVYDTIAGVIEMPLRKSPYGRHFERLDRHTLRDIGCDRAERW